MQRRLLSVLFFVSGVCAILAGFHYYLWARLVRDTGLPPSARFVFALLLAVLCVSIPLSLIGGRLLPRRIAEPLFKPVLTWMGVMFILVVATFCVDLFRVALVTIAGAFHFKLSPIAGLPTEQSFALGTLTLGLGGVASAFRGGSRFRVKRVEVPLPKLPAALDGFSFVQLSDVHVGPTIGREFVTRVVNSVNELDADALVITGDLVDGPASRLHAELAPLRDARTRHGTFFVTGNHEYYSGAEDWCEVLRGLGVRVLRNECVQLGRGDSSLDLIGIDDFSAAQFGGSHGANLPRAASGRTPGNVSVLLAHQPRAAFEAAKFDISLQLSGHTHGGQIWPFTLLVKLQQPLVSGLHRIAQTWVYVSNGTGYWGPPMRLFAPAEVTHIVLRRAPDMAS